MKTETLKDAISEMVEYAVSYGIASYGTANQKANAAFIVTACNGWDALTAERDGLREVLEVASKSLEARKYLQGADEAPNSDECGFNMNQLSMLGLQGSWGWKTGSLGWNGEDPEKFVTALEESARSALSAARGV